MPAISNKAKEMPSSPIRKLVPFAEAAKKRGVKIYHLNIGQPDIETPETFLNAVKNTSLKVLEYSHSAGNESYRKKLCGYYHQYNIELDAAPGHTKASDWDFAPIMSMEQRKGR